MLEIHTFGGLRLREAGVDAAGLGARSAEALLVYLALQRRPVPREVLADLLWPERPEATARANLRSALHRLQRAFGSHVPATRAAIGLAGTVRCDVLEFEEALRERRLAAAVDGYVGPFLAGFHLDGSPGFEAWAAGEQERLAGLVVAAHHALIDDAAAAGRAEEALEQARRLLQLEPLHEPTHRTVLRLLARLGRRRDATLHYETFRGRLLDDVGMEPDAATVRLAATLRDDEPPAGDEAVAPAPTAWAGGTRVAATEPPYRDALPAFGGGFFGRRPELATIAHRLADPDCRWLTVTGPGGVGKTRLVVEAAAQAREHFERGICFASFAEVARTDLVLPTLAQHLEVDLRLATDPARQIAAYLRDKQILLVLDDLDRHVEAVPALAALIRHAPRAKVLASSRTRLHHAEEWLLPLDGLTAPEDARALFVQRAKRADAGFDPAAHEHAIGQICASTGGLPLALELAATWINALPPERIARGLERDVTLLHAPRLDLPPRQRSVAQVFDASWDLLPPTLRQAFARLAVFHGDFEAAEAEQVAGADLTVLLALADRSLVRPGTDGRFGLHDLLRRYARARLEETGTVQEVERRHATTYAAVAERIAAGLLGSDTVGALERFRAERGHLRAALAWALAAPSEAALAVRLIDALAYGWRLTVALDEAGGALERALALPDLASRARASLLYHAGHFAWMRGDFDEADRTLRAVLRLQGEDGPALDDVPTQVSLAMTSWSRRDSEGAIARLDHVIERLQVRGEASWWLGIALGWRGKARISLSRLDVARTDLDASLRQFARLGNAWGSGIFVGVAAELHASLGDVAGARRLAVAAAAQVERVGFLHALAPLHAFLARILREDDDEREAQVHFRRAMEIYRDMGDVVSADAVEVEGLAVGGGESEPSTGRSGS